MFDHNSFEYNIANLGLKLLLQSYAQEKFTNLPKFSMFVKY